MARKVGLVLAALLFAISIGFELGTTNAYAAAKKVDCAKVMSELNSGKKPKDVAKDLSISRSSVYRCRKKESAGAKGAKTASANGSTSSTASSPAPSPSKSPSASTKK